MLVIAIGCRFMKDDAIGVLVAEHIRQDLMNHGIGVVIAETDFEFGMAAIESDDHVMILDAFYSGKEPGEITVLSLHEMNQDEAMLVSQHEQSLIDFLRQKYDINGYLIGIEAAEISYGLELSNPLRLLFNVICNSVERIIIHAQCNHWPYK